MKMLPDGTVVPHYFSVQDPRGGESSGSDNDFALRIGEVQRAICPDDQDARSDQRFVEYDVMVEYVDEETGAVTHQLYPRCTLVNPLGGIADKFTFTLRGDDSQHRDRNTPAPGLGFGSKVLVLCVQGKRHAGVIIGGVRDEQDLKDERAKGHNLHFVFNGIDCSINDAGELSIAYGGRTTIDGKRDSNVSEAMTGTKVTFFKNGNLVLATRDGDQQLTLDRENKRVQLDVRNGKLIIKASEGIEVGAATDAWVRGTTYRQAESTMLKQIAVSVGQIQGVVAGIGGAVTSLASALAAIPPAAAALGPVAGRINTIAGALGSIVSAINTFEGRSEQFLSKKNKAD